MLTLRFGVFVRCLNCSSRFRIVIHKLGRKELLPSRFSFRELSMEIERKSCCSSFCLGKNHRGRSLLSQYQSESPFKCIPIYPPHTLILSCTQPLYLPSTRSGAQPSSPSTSISRRRRPRPPFSRSRMNHLHPFLRAPIIGRPTRRVIVQI